MADLIDTLRKHKKIFAIALMVVVFGSLISTSAQTPVYESMAVIVATNEPDELLALVNSVAFENAVRDFGGHELAISGAVASQDALQGQDKEIAITFRGGQEVKEASEQALRVLEDLQDELHDVTWSKNWQEYYEAAGKDARQAEKELGALVDGMTYHHVISGPTEGHRVSPNLSLNLSLGVVLGSLLGLSSALGWAGFQAYRASTS